MYSYSNQAKETSVKHFFSEKSKFRIIEMTQHLQGLIPYSSTYES